MIPQDALINRLRELGYEFKRQTDRVMIYKKKGSTTRVMVRRKSMLDATYVKSLLQQAGLPDAEIESFVANVGTKIH